ncbi:MAG TPA: hypothetical protein ENJ37_08525 [Deltaproteobacteria bacterium]|nr:hypothetical protein [Deltaproteobacteria bacterium]
MEQVSVGRALLGAAAAIAATLVIAASAGAVHKGAGGLTCGNCHTMHNSQGNGGLGGNSEGSFTLLRGAVTNRGTIHKLCLQCHGVGGSQADVAFAPHGQKAPKVYGGNLLNWDESKDFSKIGAGGDFFKELDSNFDLTTAGSQNAMGYGHSVGLVNADPPGFIVGSPFTNDFSCTICHDPHGAPITSWTGYKQFDNFGWINGTGVNTFRNLKLYAVFFPPYYGILSETRSYVGGITGKYGEPGANYVPEVVNGVEIWPVYRGDPSDPANNNVYDGVGVEGMSGFCAQCHSFWHEDKEPGNVVGEDWRRHPVDKILDSADVSGAGVNTIDFAHYASMPAGRKLPAANADNTDLSVEYYFADADGEDKVFCLSCHFAHGGPYYDNLRWDYLSAVPAAGEQSGNSIASNQGCQQCHNR